MTSVFDIVPNYTQMKIYLNLPLGYLCEVIDAWNQIHLGVMAILTEMDHVFGNREKKDGILKVYFRELKSMVETQYEVIEKADLKFKTHDKFHQVSCGDFNSYYFQYLGERMVLHYLVGLITQEFQSPNKFSNAELSSLFKRTKIRIDGNYTRFQSIIRYWLPKVFQEETRDYLEKCFEGQNKVFGEFHNILERMKDGPHKDLALEYHKKMKDELSLLIQFREINLYRIGYNNNHLYYVGDFEKIFEIIEQEYLGWFWMVNLQSSGFFHKYREFGELYQDRFFHQSLAACKYPKMDPDHILIVDVETTGLDESENQIVEIGIAQINLQTNRISMLVDCVVKPRYFSYSDRNAWIFQNSTLTFNDVEQAWVSLDTLLPYLQYLFYTYRATAFNKQFDFKFLERLGLVIPQEQVPCLMETMTTVCNIKHDYYGVKWPSFSEAWAHYFSEGLEDLHRAGPDAFNEAKLAVKMIEDGVLKIDVSTSECHQDDIQTGG